MSNLGGGFHIRSVKGHCPPMKITSFLKFALATAALLLCFATNSSAQILYSQLTSANPVRYQLRQVNGDGSGDTAVALPFANVTNPVWSRDAGLYAVTATDPNRPNDNGMNVYVINPATGARQQITNYQDNPPDPVTRTYSFHLPYYKAFSPDRGAMAVSRFFVTAGPNGTSQVTPVLEVFSTATPANPLIVHQHRGRANTHHGLEGVDWHPAANILVTPLESSAPWLRDSRFTEPATALFRLDPVDGAVNKGLAQQITFPRADVAADFSFRWAEHDYLPRFSPNGVGVAYVRSIQGFSSGGVEPDIQSLRILNFNTGGDIEVVRFSAGSYVTSLDWSPDGGALVFSMGPQENGSTGLQQNATLQAIEIYIVNVDSTGFRRLRGGGATAPAWRPNVAQQPAVLGNVATRMRVGSGDNAMIGGFIINGSESKKVIVRGMGPSLGAVGVQGALTNPILELFQGNTLIATNDNWQQASNVNEIPNGFAPSDPRESVIVTTLAPGSYTAVIRGVGGETGIGVVETYAIGQTSNSKLANFSTRGFVESGDNAMIGGFIATGASSRVLLRAMGPSLRNAGIGNPLQDPTLQLIDGNGATVTINDNWQQATNANEIPNGFAPSDGRESAIVATLTPGNYTAIVRGSGNTTGVALVEAYHLQ